MNKVYIFVLVLVSASFVGCIDDASNDNLVENNDDNLIDPTGASDFESLERRINELENETEELRQDNDKLGNRIIDLEGENSELAESYQQLLLDNYNLSAQLDSMREELEELQQNGGDDSELLDQIAELERMVTELEEDVDELMSDKSMLYNKLYLIRDINTGSITFDDPEFGSCTDGCSASTESMFGYIETNSDIGVFQNYILFGAKSGPGDHYEESTLWISDGTPFGTFELSDLVNNPSYFTTVNQGVFFIGYDDVHGSEVWFTDATRDGTVRITNDSAYCSHVYNIYGSSDNTLFFSREDYTNACGGGYNGEKFYSAWHYSNNQFELNALDDSNTYHVGYNSYVMAGNKLYFSSTNWEDETSNLYVATYSNITLIKEDEDSFRYGSFASIGDVAYFGYGLFGKESLWQSDGTEEGTFMVKDFRLNSSDAVYVAEMSSDEKLHLIYVKVTVIPEEDDRTVNLYISDGTTDGTFSVIEGTDQDSYRFFHDEFDSSVYIMANRDSFYGDDLHFYIINETGQSADFLFNQTIGNSYFEFSNSLTFKEDIYLVGSTSQVGRELFKIDMDMEFIGILHDINPGEPQSGIDGLAYNNGKIFFSAYSPTFGGEYWYITV